jgi:nitroimidazol reductase NimA-like FMN-containing flavoprotein (pyridoxamine 5'-phosphate oxidase superfamily)
VKQRAASHSPQILRIDEEECWRLMQLARLGRVGLTDGALPTILPVHFTTHDGEVFFASLPDVKVHSADRGDILVFEVDHYDPLTGRGWAVNAVGRARNVRQQGEIRRLDGLDFTPWSRRKGISYIAIRPDLLRGRRLYDPGFDAPAPSST